MAVALICSNRSLEVDLRDTLLFRTGVEREAFKSAPETLSRMAAGGVALVAIHREVAGVEALIKTVRKSPAHRNISLVVLSEDDFDPSEIELLEAGANAILRLPPGEDFNDRLARLIAVPRRRDVRLPVRLEVAASSGFGATLPVLALNLSASGVLIESNHTLNMGDEVAVTLRFEESGALFSATAHVARTAGPNRYGARFVSISAGEDALKAFLASAATA